MLAAAVEAHGIDVVRFAFPEVASDDERDAVLAAAIRDAARSVEGPLFVGGISRGARVGAALAGSLGAVGVIAFAYPFHARHDAHPHGRVAAVRALTVPMLLCQGTRDSHGNREQVRGYDLGSVELHWLEDANHALHPRPRSGHTLRSQLTEAAAVVAAFVRRVTP